MKIAIHHTKGSYSEKWIKYCQEKNINYKIVNCYDSNIIDQLVDCDGLIWHWYHFDYKAKLFARQLIYSLEKSGKKVFPDSNTCWHFDDKVGQKYLLESMGLPLVKSHVFYDKKSAFEWINKTSFPKVFKLRSGAGALNVKLIKNRRKAKIIVNRAFGGGFPLIDNKEKVKDRWEKVVRLKNKKSIFALIRGLALYCFPNLSLDYKMAVKEKGYVYFQNYVHSKFDYRIKIVGDKCWGKIRYNRKNDFRASGSKNNEYSHELIPLELVRLSFEIAQQLDLQSAAFDFLKYNNEYFLLEISYAFGYDKEELSGYWDKKLNWHTENIIPEYLMIENFIGQIAKDKYK